MRLEVRHRLVARQHAARHRLVLLRELGHLRLDRRQVLGRERALVREVVVEAVLDHRADRHLRVGKQLLDRVGEQVRRRVADDVEAVGVLVGDDRELRRRGRCDGWCRRPAVLPSDPAGERGLGQAGADRGGDLGDRHRAGELAARAVGQLDRDHGQTPENEKARTEAALFARTGRANADAGRAAAYTLRTGVVVRGVITGMPFSLL